MIATIATTRGETPIFGTATAGGIKTTMTMTTGGGLTEGIEVEGATTGIKGA